jgi:hypothetical protein
VIEKSFDPATELTRTVPMPAEHRLCPGAGASLLLDGFRIVGVAADLPVRHGRRATVRGRQIAVFRLGERYAAVERSCPHDHIDPFDGRVVDGHLTCPTHGWSVDSAGPRCGCTRPWSATGCSTCASPRASGRPGPGSAACPELGSRRSRGRSAALPRSARSAPHDAQDVTVGRAPDRP